MNSHTKAIAVGISGGGRSLANMINRQENFDFRVKAVIASRECEGLKYAREHDIPFLVVNDSSEFMKELRRFLTENQIDLIALAGYLKYWPTSWANNLPILNIHPSLLPSFGGKGMYGINVHRAVSKSGVKETGATVHLVTENYDEGPIIAQKKVSISESMDEFDIAAAVFEKECELYPEAIDKFFREAR